MVRRILPFLLIFGLAFGAVPSGAQAMPAANAGAFINSLVGQAVDMLRDKRLPQAQRQQRFTALLQQGFDIPRISRFVLGRYWNSASPQERQQFTQLFQEWIVQTYSHRFQGYTGETVKVVSVKPQGANTAIVTSQIIRPSGGPPTQVDWQVRDGDGGYKIIDVQVEGVSMLLTERDEIGAAVQHEGGGTVAGLNHVLQQRLASGNGGSLR